MAATESSIRARAEAAGWKLEKSAAGYRVVDCNGTMVAADWTTVDGYGLSLSALEALLPKDGRK